MNKLCISCISAVVLGLAAALPASAQDRADVCMAVGLDVSGSIDFDEMRLQFDGLAAALADARFARAIQAGPRRLIAMTVYTWSGSLERVAVLVPWVGMRSGKDAQAVAALMRTAESGFRLARSTSLTVAVEAGTAILGECPWFADRQLLNVAGDGATNTGPGPAPARDRATDRGIVINALVVGDNRETVEHYRREVVGPPGIGFLVEVGDYADFAQAMINKLLLELAWTDDRGPLRQAQGEAR